MKMHRIISIFVLVFCSMPVFPSGLSAVTRDISGRQPLARPVINVDLSEYDTRQTIGIDNQGEWIYMETEEFITEEPDIGGYRFEWRSPYDGELKEGIWIPASNLDVWVFASVTYNDTLSVFQYAYTVVNGEKSEQSIHQFMLSAKVPFLSGEVSSTDWNSKSLPGWGGIHWNWWCTQRILQVSPGEQFDGFLATSKGLPDIQACYARAFTYPIRVQEEMPFAMQQVYRIIFPLFTDCVSGVTVGPGELHTSVAKVRGHIEESHRQGWLTSDTRRDVLLGYIEKLEVAETEDDYETFQSLCNELLESVAAMRSDASDPLSDEAYALLHFNVAWLRDHAWNHKTPLKPQIVEE